MIRALLLAIALSGCEGQRNACPSCGYPWPIQDSIAQADPTKEADWPSIEEEHAQTLHEAYSRAARHPDPYGEADWPRLAARTVDLELVDATERVIVRVPIDPGTDWYLVDARHGFNVYQYAESPLRPDSLTVTNATPRTLLLEQECVVTLAKPGSTQTVALEGSVTIREEASYDE